MFDDGVQERQQVPPQEPRTNADASESVWDPAGERVTRADFQEDVDAVSRWMETAAGDPDRLKKRSRIFALCIAIDLGLSAVLWWYFHFPFVAALLPGIVLCAAAGKWYMRDTTIATDARKLLYARENGWLYSPNRRSGRLEVLQKAFPALFRLGNESRSLEDEWWGSVPIAGKPTDCWLARFTYAERQGKHSTSYEASVIGLRLPRLAQWSLSIVPETMGKRFLNLFTRRDLDTSSDDFDRAFTVVYDGDKDRMLPFLKRTVTPPLQHLLLALKRNYERGGVLMAVRQDALLILVHAAIPTTGGGEANQATMLTAETESRMRREINAFVGEVEPIHRHITSVM